MAEELRQVHLRGALSAPRVEMPGLQGVAGAIALLSQLREKASLRFEDYAELARTGP